MADEQDPINELLARLPAQGPLGRRGGKGAPILDPFQMAEAPSRVPSWKEFAPDLVGMIVSMVGGSTRPILGPLSRILASAGASYVTSRVLGEEKPQAGMRALKTGGTQLAAEVPFAAGRTLAAQPIAKRMLAERAEQEALLGKKREFNQAFAEGLTGVEQQTHKATVADIKEKYKQDLRGAKAEHLQAQQTAEQTFQTQSRAYAEAGAKHIADSFKEAVPSWKDIPSSEKGLLEMVYGGGQEKLSAMYDASLREIVKEGTGRNVFIPYRDAQALRVKVSKRIGARVGAEDIAQVDAGQLAQRMTGQSRKEPGAYGRAADALEKAGLGDPNARAEYKSGQALIQYVDKTKMLEGEVFHPDRAQAGFTQLKTLEQFRRRGMGNIFEGPFSEAVRAGKPEMGAVPPMRDVPPPNFPLSPFPHVAPEVPGLPPSQIRERSIFPWGIGAAAAEGGALLAGHHGYGVPAFLGGHIAQGLLPQKVYTNVPVGPYGTQAIQRGPGLTAEILRLLLTSSSS